MAVVYPVRHFDWKLCETPHCAPLFLFRLAARGWQKGYFLAHKRRRDIIPLAAGVILMERITKKPVSGLVLLGEKTHFPRIHHGRLLSLEGSEKHFNCVFEILFLGKEILVARKKAIWNKKNWKNGTKNFSASFFLVKTGKCHVGRLIIFGTKICPCWSHCCTTTWMKTLAKAATLFFSFWQLAKGPLSSGRTSHGH